MTVRFLYCRRHDGKVLNSTVDSSRAIDWALNGYFTGYVATMAENNRVGERIPYKGVLDSFDELYDVDCSGVYYITEIGNYYLHLQGETPMWNWK